MKLLSPCSEVVKAILDYWPEIPTFVAEKVKTWRGLKAATLIPFSQNLADSLYERLKNNDEVEVFKDQYYHSWGSAGLKVQGRQPWYFPYSLIQLCAFGVTLDDLLTEIDKGDIFIDFSHFIDTIARIDRTLSVSFKTREIDLFRAILMEINEREPGTLGIPSFTRLSEIIGISLTQVRNYWLNLDKFFVVRILINYGKVGLHPVLVKHGRELTDLEKQYTKSSFFDHGDYYSLLFIPWNSNWVEANERDDCNFVSLGEIQRMDYNWNLTHFTENAEIRWGSYPGLLRQNIRMEPAISMDFIVRKDVEGMHIQDFKIIDEMAKVVGKYTEAVKELGFTESYFSQRVKFLSENGFFYPTVFFRQCGLDAEMLLVLYAHSDSQSSIKMLERTASSLIYFPNMMVYLGTDCLLARLLMPSKWVNQFLLEFQNLSEPDGQWYDSGLRAVTHHGRTRSSIMNPLSNLWQLIVEHKRSDNRPGKLNIDWTFEIPATSENSSPKSH
ncbi:MAG: hypothetical protein ACFFD4_09910 [Candidatus Odinarchaeota archaeon]